MVATDGLRVTHMHRNITHRRWFIVCNALWLSGCSSLGYRIRLDDAQLTTVTQQADAMRGAGKLVAVVGLALGSLLFAALLISVLYIILGGQKMTVPASSR